MVVKAKGKHPVPLNPERPPTLNEIYEAVCKHRGVPVEDYRRRVWSRHQNHLTGIWADMMTDIVGLMRHMTSASFPEIARAIGYKSHNSVHYRYQSFCQRPGIEQAQAQMEIRRIITKMRKEQANDSH